MLTEPLSLDHQSLLESKFHALSLPISEFSFANLYLFRNTHCYELIQNASDYFIKGIMRDGTPFIFLTSPPSKEAFSMISQLLAKGGCLFPIPEQWLPLFDRMAYQAILNDNDSDYLFSRHKLAYFPGRHLSKKRNLVKQLFATHTIRTENLTKALTKDALAVLETWHREHLISSSKDDYEPCKEGLELLETLNLHGRIVYVDDRPAGFTLGERLSIDYFVVHFCKASPHIKGLYQYLYSDIATIQEESCGWMNLEQDLGLPLLKKAKHSYLPDQLLHKWCLFRT